MGNTDRHKDISANNDELKKLYEIYLQVQSGDQTALNELFRERNTDNKQIYKADVRYKKYRLSNMDNVLDSELVLANEKENEKRKQEKEWINSSYSKVAFKFSCLNKLLYKKKKKLLSRGKNTGYENGKKSSGHRKLYEGKYDISDFNELMYETIIEIFTEKTDESNCLTLDGKKNEKYPICDGISLLRNISYFTSRKINKRTKNSYLDIFDTEYYNEEFESESSYFDKYALKEFLESEGATSRLTIYVEYLEWLKRNDVYKFFKANACDIKAIIETIKNCEDIFIEDIEGDIESGLGMHLVKQEVLQEIIKYRHNINIEQGNISKDLEIIEQRLLDHLFYSLNYRIGKAEESKGIYEKESERFLCKLDNGRFVRIFGRTIHTVYDASITFINSDINNNDFDSYFKIIKRYEDMIIDIVSLKKGKKKYDMVNLILENDDLVEDKRKALIDIADTVISYCQRNEKEYIKDKLTAYRIKGLADWEKGYWEAELGNEILDIKLWSSKDIKNPIHRKIGKENLMVYCGYMNFYFCNIESKVCYRVPKNRRIISRANKNHEIFMYGMAERCIYLYNPIYISRGT